jgi:hypothetical protein
MKRVVLALFLTDFVLMAQEQQKVTNQEIAGAVLPLPEQLRSGSAVVRLSQAGFPESIRKGTNGMVCVADRPGDETFDVRCYHESFISVVYRGFQLNAEGVKLAEVYNTIEAEIKAGKLTIPSQPTAGYRCLGPASGINASTNSLSKDIRCWQSIHFPFRTAHEMGLMDESELPEDMRSKMPYVMASGRYWAHVMIEHPQGETNSDHAH